MRTQKILVNSLRVLLPFIVGAAVLYWIYRGTSWSEISRVVFGQMNWGWMIASLLVGVLPQVLRGWRWRLALEPIGERPRRATTVWAIFISYAASLVVPRIGEITRCATLTKYEGTSFSKSLGTVVSERVVDVISMLLITGLTLLLQWSVVERFFSQTGTNFGRWLQGLSGVGFWLVVAAVLACVTAVFCLLRRSRFFSRLHSFGKDFVAGISSLLHMRRLPLYLFYSVAIWACYYLHFTLTFFCFDFTSHLGFVEGLAAFCAGMFAVLIPTPNGAGPWHFAVKTMLVMYGVSQSDAILFALVVHTLQTGLIILLGIVGGVMLAFTKRTRTA